MIERLGLERARRLADHRVRAPGRGMVDGFFHVPSGALGIERLEYEDLIERVIVGRIH